MLARLSAALVALTLSACAAHEAPPTTTGNQPEKPPEPKAPHAALTIAIASVTLQQDCPDPPEPVASVPPSSTSAIHPPPPTAAGQLANAPAQPAPMPEREMAASRKMSPGAALADDSRGGWHQPCTQSTMQLSLTNTGDAPGKLAIKAVRLLDAASKKPLGTLTARRPTQWSEPGKLYEKWDEQLLPGATLKVAYSLNDPDWSAAQQTLGHANFYTTPFVLEVDVAVDGTVQTVRSPEFMRQEVHLIVT